MGTRYLKIREPKLNDISRVSDARRVDHSRELWSIVFGEERGLVEDALFRKRKLNKAFALRFLLPHYMNNLFALQFRKDGFDGPWIPNPGFRTKPNSVILRRVISRRKGERVNPGCEDVCEFRKIL